MIEPAKSMSTSDAPSQLHSLVETAVSERSITDSVLLFVAEGKLNESDQERILSDAIEGNGNFSLSTDSVTGSFHGNHGSYQLRLKLAYPIKSANGITVRYRLSGWDEIRYLAIGHTKSGLNRFRHVKITNPSIGEWVTFTISYNDIAYGLVNSWKKPNPAGINDVRIYVKGKPGDGGAIIEMAWASTWLEDECEATPGTAELSNPLLVSELTSYFKKCNSKLSAQVEDFLNTGSCPMTGNSRLQWDIRHGMPADLDTSRTYRYLWHAMHPAISMMVYGLDHQKMGPIFSARDYINDWLNRSFFSIDPDVKYTWYDHGTAERLMALILMHQIGLIHEFDHRFMARLNTAIIRHAQLLESEVFYSFHQPTRYHNHAWFQDMALITASIAFPHLSCSSRWRNRAIERLNDQLAKLIVRDGGYAIFVENSIGYHHGIKSLVEFAGALVDLTGEKTEIPGIANELNAWSDFLRYPDKRPPTHGDTFRKPNPVNSDNNIIRGKAYRAPGLTVLPAAGYAVAKGNHNDTPYMLCMFSTSLCKTHKHEDNLSITLFFDGIEWLIDPSFYSHDYENSIPAYLRSAEAHNNLWVPGCTYSLDPGKSSLFGNVDGNSYSLNGQHEGYKGYVICRSIKGDFNDLHISITDSIESVSSDKVPECHVVFHAGEGVVINAIAGGGYELKHPLSKYKLVIMAGESSGSVFRGVGPDNKPLSVSGTGYNEMIATESLLILLPVNNLIEYNVRAILDTKLSTALHDS